MFQRPGIGELAPVRRIQPRPHFGHVGQGLGPVPGRSQDVADHRRHPVGDLSRTRPELVVEFLEPRAARASGVTMREGVKYLDPEDAERLMALYRGR